MKKVCLNGTRKTDWRSELISLLKIDYFDTFQLFGGGEKSFFDEVDGCDLFLYVIEMDVEYDGHLMQMFLTSATTKPEATFFCALGEKGQLSDSYEIIAKRFKAPFFTSIQKVADELNKHHHEFPLNVNMIECLIERDGPTQITWQSFTYNFIKNVNGDYVCEVLNAAHRDHFLKLSDFRIYQDHLFPPPEFSKEESDCIREWQYLSSENLMAYVNGRISKLQDMSNKLRKRLLEKWIAIVPWKKRPGMKESKQQECPVKIDPEPVKEDLEPVEEVVTPIELEQMTAEEEKDFIDTWLLLRKEQFFYFVPDKIESFKRCSEETLKKARSKWFRLGNPDDTWPL